MCPKMMHLLQNAVGESNMRGLSGFETDYKDDVIREYYIEGGNRLIFKVMLQCYELWTNSSPLNIFL